jgi:hypothetical protein
VTVHKVKVKKKKKPFPLKKGPHTVLALCHHNGCLNYVTPPFTFACVEQTPSSLTAPSPNMRQLAFPPGLRVNRGFVDFNPWAKVPDLTAFKAIQARKTLTGSASNRGAQIPVLVCLLTPSSRLTAVIVNVSEAQTACEQALQALHLDATDYTATLTTRGVARASSTTTSGTTIAASGSRAQVKRATLGQGLKQNTHLYMSPNLDALGVPPQSGFRAAPDESQPAYVLTLLQKAAPQLVGKPDQAGSQGSLRQTLVSQVSQLLSKGLVAPPAGYYLVEEPRLQAIIDALSDRPGDFMGLLIKTTNPRLTQNKNLCEKVSLTVTLIFA